VPMKPSQFSVNEAWIFFQLNYEPIPTEIDGDIDCFALMDAASLFILSSTFVKGGSLNLSNDEIGQLFQSAYSHKQVWPERLFVPKGLQVSLLESEAESRSMKVVPVKKGDISVFTREACQAFKAHIQAGLGQ
jgi:hypothetical protein